MKPTIKSQAMEQFLTKVSGSDRRTAIEADVCRPAPMGCGKPIDGFRDDLSAKEYRISGMCQTCQDKVFGP